jgi:outer membrane biosynthesis protein TonB
MSYPVEGGKLVLAQEAMTLNVVAARKISPAYQLSENAPSPKNGTNQLFAFTGVGLGITLCRAVHSAYVAFVRSQPVFALYHNEKGVRIKPLMEGVRIKLKGQKPEAGKIGVDWHLASEQISSATIIRGAYWWRFNLVPVLAPLEDGPDEEALLEQEGTGLRKMLAMLAALFLLFGVAVWMSPRSEAPPAEVKPETPIVKFVITPKTVSVPLVAVEPSKSVKKAEPKPDPMPAKTAAGAAPNKPAKPKAPAPVRSAPDAKVAAAKKASEKLNMLRAALGGAAALSRPVAAKNLAPAKQSNVFAQGTTSAAPTEIKPTYVAGNAKVAAVGGYGKNEAPVIGGRGTSFVSVDNGGPTVEEGLRKDQVGEVIHKHMDEVRYCHEMAMLYHPDLAGKIVARFVIGGNGHVEKTAADSSGLPDRTLEDCVLKRLATWKFPKPKGGVKVNVSYPFIFKTLSRE